MKFGGTSVGDASRIGRVAEIVSEYVDYSQIVVVSAMSGTTDRLVQAYANARVGESWLEEFQAIESGHYAALEQLGGKGSERERVKAKLAEILAELKQRLEAVPADGTMSHQQSDSIVSFGERLSVRLVAFCLNTRGIAAQAVEATELIVTTSDFGDAEPLLELTERRSKFRLEQLLRQGITPIVTGFIGSTTHGETTTLGRGGSDYTATIIGYCVDAEEVIIWTDVPGVMTTDPRVVSDARTIQSLSYDEAADLSHFGAKVLHPLTMVPASLKNTPIRIKNSFRVEAPGTLITDSIIDASQTVKAITPKKDLTLISITDTRRNVLEVLTQVGAALADCGVTPYLMTHASAIGSVSVVVDMAKREVLLKAIESHGKLEKIRSEDDISIIAIVGSGIYSIPGLYAKAFTALSGSGVKFLAIASDASQRSLSIAIKNDDTYVAIRSLHQGLQLIRTEDENE
jgi:aspartate kinase